MFLQSKIVLKYPKGIKVIVRTVEDVKNFWEIHALWISIECPKRLQGQEGMFLQNGLQCFWHSWPVLRKTIFFMDHKVGECYWDDSRSLHLLCILFLLLLHQLHLRSSGIRSRRLGIPVSTGKCWEAVWHTTCLLPVFTADSMNAKRTLLGYKTGNNEQHGYGLHAHKLLKCSCWNSNLLFGCIWRQSLSGGS